MSTPSLTLLSHGNFSSATDFRMAALTTEPNLSCFPTLEMYAVWASVAQIVMQQPELRHAASEFLQHCFPQVGMTWLKIPPTKKTEVGAGIEVIEHEDRFEVYSAGIPVETLPPDQLVLDRFLNFLTATPYTRPRLVIGEEIPSFTTRDVKVVAALSATLSFVLALILFL